MALGSFLFGSSGGLSKSQQRVLDAELAALDPNDLAAITAYAQKRVAPTFRRARQGLASQYVNADAPITAGGRTQGEIGLAGEEAGSIADIIEEERRQRRAMRQGLLGIKLKPKDPSSGLFANIATGFGAFAGAGGLDLLKHSQKASVLGK